MFFFSQAQERRQANSTSTFSPGVIAGITIAVVVFVVLFSLLMVLTCSRLIAFLKKKKICCFKPPNEVNPEDGTGNPTADVYAVTENAPSEN